MLTRRRVSPSLAAPFPVRVANLHLGRPLDPSVNVIAADEARREEIIEQILDAIRHGAESIEVLADGKRTRGVPLVPDCTRDDLVLDEARLLALAAGPAGALAVLDGWLAATTAADDAAAVLAGIDRELVTLEEQTRSAETVAAEALDVLAGLERHRNGAAGLAAAIDRLTAAAPAAPTTTDGTESRLDALVRRRAGLAENRREQIERHTALATWRRNVADALARWHQVASTERDPYAANLADTIEATLERRSRLAAATTPSPAALEAAARAVEEAETPETLRDARRRHADLLAACADANALEAADAQLAELEHLASRVLRVVPRDNTIELLRNHPLVDDDTVEALATALWAAGVELHGTELPTIAARWLAATPPSTDLSTATIDAAIAATDNEMVALLDDLASVSVTNRADERVHSMRLAAYRAAAEAETPEGQPVVDPDDNRFDDKWAACEELVAQACATIGAVDDRRTIRRADRRRAAARARSALDARTDALVALLEHAPHVIGPSGTVDPAALDRHVRRIRSSTPATLAEWLDRRTERHRMALPIVLDRALDGFDDATSLAIVTDLAAASRMTQFIVLTAPEEAP